MYGLVTGEPSVEHCFMCPENWKLAFEPQTVLGSKGFIIPGSFPLTLEGEGGPETVLVPIPFSALIVGTSHNEGLQDPYGVNFDDDWMATVRKLLPLIPDLKPGEPLNLGLNVGYPAGERKPMSLKTSHPFMWVVYGRGLLDETSRSSTLGLANFIMNSRFERGSLPDRQSLWEKWNELEFGSMAAYHEVLVDLARKLNLLRPEQ